MPKLRDKLLPSTFRDTMKNNRVVHTLAVSVDYLRLSFIISGIFACFGFVLSLMFVSPAFADGRLVNKTLWVATPVDVRAQFFGIPISQTITTPEMSIYFANNGTAYFTITGSKETSKGLVLPPGNTTAEVRDQQNSMAIKMYGTSSDLYIELAISTPLPQNNSRMDVKADWRVNILNNNCIVIDRHFALSVPGNQLMNSVLNPTVGTAACKIYPGRVFL